MALLQMPKGLMWEPNIFFEQTKGSQKTRTECLLKWVAYICQKKGVAAKLVAKDESVNQSGRKEQTALRVWWNRNK